jgi:hypothetical protein
LLKPDASSGSGSFFSRTALGRSDGSWPVRAKVEGGLGEINARGLTKDGKAYVNAAYKDSNGTLEVDVEGGVGEINLKVV